MWWARRWQASYTVPVTGLVFLAFLKGGGEEGEEEEEKGVRVNSETKESAPLGADSFISE